MVMRNAASLLLALMLVPACTASTADGDIEDGENDNLGGKSDGFLEGTDEARAILALVNDPATDVARLDIDAGLSSRAATNIIVNRGTGYATIVALDAVPYVGPRTLAALLEFAKSAGYFVASDPRLYINWTLQQVDGVVVLCPAGYDTVALYARPIGADGQQSGNVIVDLFDCDDRVQSVQYAPGTYHVWLAITTSEATMAYATSATTVVDLTIQTHLAVDFSILTDGGYFAFDWKLQGATSGQTLQCADVPGQAGVAIDATVSGSTQLFSDIFDCEADWGMTGGLAAGSYTLSTSIIDAGNQVLGLAEPMTGTIEPRNALTDLGSITIPVDGR